MPAIVEFPKVVRDAVRDFGELFSCEPQRRHFAEYLTGLMIAHNKTVTGMGDYQLRNGQGQTRHMYLVMLAYSLLTSQLKQGHAKDWALCRLTTIGEACRAMLNETLRTTLAWAIEQVTEKSRSYDHVVANLGLT